MKSSEIRALFSVVSRPEVVSLAGGMPAVTALPLDAVGSMIGELVSGMGAQTLQYGSGQGDPAAARADLRRHGAGGHHGRLAQRGRGHRRLPAGPGPGHPRVLRPGRRHPRRGAVLRRRARRLPGRAGPRPARRHGRARPDPGGAGGGADRLPRQRRPGQVPLHRAELPQPGRRDAVRAPPRGDRGPRREVRPADHRGQPLRPARLRARAAARAARPQQPAGHLPRLVLQDVLPGPAGGLGAGAARRPREARPGHRGAGALPAVPHPVRRRPVPGHAALARADQDLHRAVPRAPRRLPGVPGRRSCPPAPPGRGPRAASTSG